MSTMQNINDQIEKDILSMLQKYDKDGDKSISKDEVIQFLIKEGKSRNPIATTKALFRRLDTDNDGVISLDEIRANSTKIHVEKAIQDEIQKVLRCNDDDNNKEITLDEMAHNFVVSEKLSEDVARQTASIYFEAIDKNQDGKITVEELRRYVTAGLNLPQQ